MDSHKSAIVKGVTDSSWLEAPENRSPRNDGLGLVGMSAFSSAAVDNRGHIVISDSICDARISEESRSDRSARTNL